LGHRQGHGPPLPLYQRGRAAGSGLPPGGDRLDDQEADRNAGGTRGPVLKVIIVAAWILLTILVGREDEKIEARADREVKAGLIFTKMRHMLRPIGKSEGEILMKRCAAILLFSLTLSFVQGLIFGQFQAEEIARRGEMETFLLTAEIVRFEPVGEGVTHPYRLHLKKGDFETTAFWKNPSGMMNGYLEGWRYEIAAYRLDKLIGLNMVPVTVEREFQGKKGDLSLYAKHKHSLLEVAEKNIPTPDDALDRVNKAKWLTRAWDSLVANDDRTQQNILVTEDWRTILIDHSRAFRSTEEFTERLMYGANGIKRSQTGSPFLFRRLPRWFVEKIRGLTFESIKGAVSETLTDAEIRAILVRRDLLIKEIEAQVRQQGEANILYD
jgi:hypothetical protein